AGAEVRVRNHPAEMSVNFSPDILSILTTKGCNGSGCHGSPVGQNGFKLSLFGYDGAADYQMIVKEQDGRRVNLQDPAKSLLLLKPTFVEPHGGGRLLSEDSDEYRLLLKWLEQGARQNSSGTRLTKLEMAPTERILVSKGSHQSMVVIGRLSDGTTRDMIREVRYVVRDDVVGENMSDGTLSVKTHGITTVTTNDLGSAAPSWSDLNMCLIGLLNLKTGCETVNSTCMGDRWGCSKTGLDVGGLPTGPATRWCASC